ncbi:hypothetical protein K438DRAFT_1867741 [Mycena galopus ATCC 62051]|nr:hypothetical protein K438DRAFT_1867741 [Mycena galopus ATCC 62051]
MHLSLAFAAAVHALFVSAANILVVVGPNDKYEFSPSNVTANVGDVIAFQFQNKNHSVVQSTFANPCQASTLNGLDLLLDIAVSNCEQGMVFSVNAVENGPHNFSAFQAQARALGGNTLDTLKPQATLLAISSPTATPTVICICAAYSANATLAGPSLRLESQIDDAKQEAPPAQLPTPTIQTAPAQDDRTPALVLQPHIRPLPSLPPTGPTHPSTPDQAALRKVVFGKMPAEEEKARSEAAQQMGIIQREIRQLMQQAEAQKLARSTAKENERLMDSLRVITDRMHGLEQQMQSIGQEWEEAPPQYTGR